MVCDKCELYIRGIEDTLSTSFIPFHSTVRSTEMICWQNRFSSKDMTAERHHYYHYYYDDDDDDDDGDDINDRKCIFHSYFRPYMSVLNFILTRKAFWCGAASLCRRCLVMTGPGAFWTFRHNAYFYMIKFALARLTVEWFVFIWFFLSCSLCAFSSSAFY